MEHEFELRFQLGSARTDTDALIERLYEAGCDDALIGSGRPGHIVLTFSREAASAIEAIVSAVEDVRRAAAGAVLIDVVHEVLTLDRVAPQLVPG